MKRPIGIMALAAILGVAVLSGSAYAQQEFTAKGPTGCTDKRCWNTARFGANNKCNASGCKTSCSLNQTAADTTSDAKCLFNNGYTCWSTCKAPPCAAAPTISASVSPETIWPPNHKTVTLTLSGSISAPSGCSLSGASYSLSDSEGIFNQSGPLAVSGGAYSASVQVEASRLGGNLDGRTYTLTVTAADAAGSSSASATALVPHDQRKK